MDEAEEDANLEEKSASGRGGGIPSVIWAGRETRPGGEFGMGATFVEEGVLGIEFERLLG